MQLYTYISIMRYNMVLAILQNEPDVHPECWTVASRQAFPRLPGGKVAQPQLRMWETRRDGMTLSQQSHDCDIQEYRTRIQNRIYISW